MPAVVSFLAARRPSADVGAGIPQRLGPLGLNLFCLLNQECCYLEAVDSFTESTTAQMVVGVPLRNTGLGADV